MITKEKFEFLVNKFENGCWIWIGGVHGNGYGSYHKDGINTVAHRLSAYLYLNLDLNSTALVCHKCDNRLCVNPEHLYIGNYSTNSHDAVSSGTHNMTSKTHCPQGHEYNKENTRIYQYRRYCKKCSNTKIRVIMKDTGKIRWVRSREFEILKRNDLLL